MNPPGDTGASADMDSSARDLDPLRLSGQTVSNFRIGSALAAGGMGVVYRAEDMRLQRSVALKFPLPTLAVDRITKERFLHEARSIGALDHPNICTIHEAGETAGGHLFFAMPLYSGETLKDRLAREGRLDIDAAIAITHSVAAGLRAAHSRGIIHRDIKPSNVMLLDDGSVKILDFGLAKVQDLTLTEAGSLVGTVAYMSPEQIEGQPVDARTDLWSMGVTLYEMIAGQRPFAGEYDIALAYNILHTEAPALSAKREGAPPNIERVVRTLLSRDPAMRYGSADELLTALRGVDGATTNPPTGQLRSASDNNALHKLVTRARGRVRTLTVPSTAGVIAVFVLVAIVAAGVMVRGMAPPAPAKTLAVLPFNSLSEKSGDNYLAVGLGDAIATELARLQSLVVPTTATMADYRGTKKSSLQIAHEMQAAAVLRGDVKRLGELVDATVTLTDATGKRIWSQHYQRSVDDMLDVQRDVAASVVKALHLRLSATERETMRRIPTKDAGAYALYLQGMELELRDAENRPGAAEEQFRDLQSLYARARDIDPDFALARARLALVEAYNVSVSRDRTPGRLDHVRLEAEAALRRQPGLAEAHEALAMYYGPVLGNYAQAVEQLKLALLGAPNSKDYHSSLGTSYRNMGRWQDAVMEYDSAMRLEPRNPSAAVDAATTYSRMRRYEKAIIAWNRAIALAPQSTSSKVIRGHVYVRWTGSVDTLEAALRSAPPTWDPNGMGTWARHWAATIRGEHKRALDILDASHTRLINDSYLYRPVSLLRGQTYADLGDHRRARENYENALGMLLDSVAVHPEEGRIHIGLGLVYAGLGRKADAVREARAGMDAAPVRINHLVGTAMMESAAEIYARVAEPERAIGLLELLLEMQAGREVSVPLLRVEPAFASLRSEPRFQQLLKRYD